MVVFTNDHLANIGDSVLLVDGTQSMDTWTVQNLTNFRFVLCILGVVSSSTTTSVITNILPVDLFKAGVILQFDMYDGSTRHYGNVKYVSDTSVSTNDFHNISGNWKMFLYGIK